MMNFRQVVLTAVFTFGIVSPVPAADKAAGKAIVAYACIECHGMNGIGVEAKFPNLAGQKEMYLFAQLRAFRERKRRSPVMNLMARPLSDADMANLAAYYSSLPCTAKGAKKK